MKEAQAHLIEGPSNMTRFGLAVCLALVAVRPASATTVTYLDETAIVGDFASLAIGADGLGLIAYQDVTNSDLKTAHCSNTACTAATLSTIDSAGNVGWQATLVIGADGRGLIAYFDATNQAVKTAHCNDLACTSAVIRVIEPANMFGTIGLTIGSDGLPLLAYVDGPRLHAAHCTAADCSTVTINDVASTTGGIQGAMVAVGADGLGLVALERQQTGDVIDVRRCQDVACSSLSPPSPPAPAENAFVRPRTLVVPADGRPLIGYFYWNMDVTPQALEVRIRRCTEPTCFGLQVPTFAFLSAYGPDVALQANGLPWFAYAHNPGKLVVRRCTDPACTSTVSACSHTGANDLSLATGTDGRSLVAFQSSIGLRLAVAHDVSDPCPQLVVADVVATEAPGAQAVFAVTLTLPSPENVTVAYTTANASAVAGEDYVAVSGTLTFPPNTLTAQVPVPILADGVDEPQESFSFLLSSPVGAVLADAVGIGTIVDADPPPRIVTGDCARVEGDAGTLGCGVGVTLVGTSTQPVTVAYATADGTATGGADYVAASGTLTFAPGSGSETVSVAVVGDVTVELDETFFVNLSNPVNATIGDGQGQGLIVDDDAPSLSSLELTHGSRLTADLAAQPGPVADQDAYRLAQGQYSSWEVVVDEVSGDVAPGLLLERLAEDNSTVLQTGAPVGTGPARALRWQRRAATPEVRHHIRVRSTSCTTDCGADDTYRLRAYETTGVIPRFNNSGSQITVVILQNATDQPVQAYTDFWGASGVLVASVPVTLAPNGVGVINTSSIPALAGTSGSVSVTHDGPYGGVAGKAVALEPSTGFSFDSPMSSRPR
jgi:hypothetical protein